MSKDDHAAAPAIATVSLTVTRGVAAGWFAGIPQVVLAQAVGLLVGSRERADIAPRFLRQVARHTGSPLSRPMQWLLGGVFHFEYAAGWGASYAVAAELLGAKRVPPALGGGVLGALIYTAAFSRIGAATQTGAERHPDERRGYEWAVQLTSAFSYGLTMAYTYRWLRERW